MPRTTPKRREKLQVYRAADGWRWRVRARNGLIVATGGEAYARKDAAHRGVGIALRALQAIFAAADGTP